MRKIFVFKKLKKDNKGAGFFTVIVAALFLMVLSAALIYSSFTAYRVKISAKKSNSAFYYADMAIEEIKTGFQKVISDSARAGYENVLSCYTSDVSQTEVFKKAYLKSFTDFKYITDTGSESYLFYKNVSTKIEGVYRDGIKSFLSPDINNDKLTVTSVSDASNPIFLPCTQDAKGNVTIKGLKAEYTDGEYTAYITTDIKLKIPDVTLSGAYDLGGLDKYVFVADGGFEAKQEGATSETHLGNDNEETNAFFGEIKVGAGRDFICNDSSKVVVGKVDRAAADGVDSLQTTGKISISGPSGTSLIFGKNCTLFAADIELSEYGTLKQDDLCKTYVADDLSLEGESKAYICGRYYGFGTSNYDSSPNINNATDSSSVLFPKRTKGGESKATLDLSRCDSFTLAGRSYITNGRDEEGRYSDVGMGPSISSTKEQLVYLVPAGYLVDGKNPTVLKGTREEVDAQTAAQRQKIEEILSSKTLFTLKDGTQKKATDYLITSAGDIKSLIYPIPESNQWAVYYFFDFKNRLNDSNNYFKDFFNTNGNDIMEYLNDYATIEGDAAKIYTAGTGAITKNNQITITEAAQTDLTGEANVHSQAYKNLSQTMNDKSPAEGKSPFLTLVNVKYLHEVIEAAKTNPEDVETTYGLTIEKDKNGNAASENSNYGGKNGYCVRFVSKPTEGKGKYDIAEGDYYLHDFSNDFHLVICNGDVHIKGNFYGLIICSGKIYNETTSFVGLDSSSPQDEKGVSIFTNSKFYTGNAVTPNDDDWNMDDQVVFENWKKNEG